jgi:hypothetical protein
VTDEVHGAVKPMKAALRDAVSDCSTFQTGIEELSAADHAVLPRGHCRDRRIGVSLHLHSTAHVPRAKACAVLMQAARGQALELA